MPQVCSQHKSHGCVTAHIPQLCLQPRSQVCSTHMPHMCYITAQTICVHSTGHMCVNSTFATSVVHNTYDTGVSQHIGHSCVNSPGHKCVHSTYATDVLTAQTTGVHSTDNSCVNSPGHRYVHSTQQIC